MFIKWINGVGSGKDRSIKKLCILLFLIFFHGPVYSTANLSYLNLIGNVRVISVDENEIQNIEYVSQEKQYNKVKFKVAQIFNVWLLILSVILNIKCKSYISKLPVRKNLVSMRVRMNN